MASKLPSTFDIGPLVDLISPELAASVLDKKKKLLIRKFISACAAGDKFHEDVNKKVDEELTKLGLRREDILKRRPPSNRGKGPSSSSAPPPLQITETEVPAASSSSSEAVSDDDEDDEEEEEVAVEEPLTRREARKRLREYKKLKDIVPEALSEDELVIPADTGAAGEGGEGAGTATAWTVKNKRHLTWYLRPIGGRDDQYNERNPDGTLKALGTYRGFKDKVGNVIKESDPIPDVYLTDEFIEAIDIISEINGQPFFDPETNALGRLSREEYLIIPAEVDVPVVDVKDVGTGLKQDQFDFSVVAAIYTLAKIQAEELGMEKSKARKWAFLRMEAVKVGWYANQPYVMRKRTPKNAIEILARDTVKFRGEISAAHKICGFIPFLHEFCFRTFGSTYTIASSAEYVARADKFAISSKEETFSHYLDHDKLFGLCLRWVGIRRPMEVLKASVTAAKTVIPDVFQLRMRSAPSGQALVTTSLAAIASMESANWWEGIAQAGGFDTVKFTATAEKILRDPWKYHVLCQSYGYSALTQDDVTEVQAARDLAVKMSPILQSYLDVILVNTPLGRAKALRRHADGHAALKARSKRLFMQASKLPLKDVHSLFQTHLFKAKKVSKRARTIESGSESVSPTDHEDETSPRNA